MKINITLDYEWKKVESSEGKCYLFDDEITGYMKKNYRKASVYQWVIDNSEGKKKVYVGQTHEICPERIREYLIGHKSQKTNHRIKGKLTEEKDNGHSIKLEYLSITKLEIDKIEFKQEDLSYRYLREFIENLILMQYRKDDEIELLNSEGEQKNGK